MVATTEYQDRVTEEFPVVEASPFRLIIPTSLTSFRLCPSLPLEPNHNKLSYGFTVSAAR